LKVYKFSRAFYKRIYKNVKNDICSNPSLIIFSLQRWLILEIHKGHGCVIWYVTIVKFTLSWSHSIPIPYCIKDQPTSQRRKYTSQRCWIFIYTSSFFFFLILPQRVKPVFNVLWSKFLFLRHCFNFKFGKKVSCADVYSVFFSHRLIGIWID
jgi:hypothetical protein